MTPELKAKVAAAKPATVFDDTAPELARTYSEALLNAAQKEGNVEAVLDELDAIRTEVLEAHPAFAAMMRSPSRTAADKEEMIVRLFEGKVQPIVVKFLRVLSRHGRIEILGAITRAARAAWDKRQNRRPVSVRSAVPLDDAQLTAIRDRLAAAFGGTPVLTIQVDPSLIGGLVVQIGDDVYDASVRNRLELLRQRLIEGTTHEIQSRRDYFSSPE